MLEVRHQPTEGLESGSATAPNPRKAQLYPHRALEDTAGRRSNHAGECDNTPTSDSIPEPHLLLNASIHQRGTRWNTRSRVSDLGRVSVSPSHHRIPFSNSRQRPNKACPPLRSHRSDMSLPSRPVHSDICSPGQLSSDFSLLSCLHPFPQPSKDHSAVDNSVRVG